MRRTVLNSKWADRILGTIFAMAPLSFVLAVIGWGPHSYTVGEWYIYLGSLGSAPALLAVLAGLVSVRLGYRDAGVGLIGAVSAVVLLWTIGIVAYGFGFIPPGMADPAGSR